MENPRDTGGVPETNSSSDQSRPKDQNQPILTRIKRWWQKLPDKKQYLEFITALLTIPVLLTVIISNVQNLQKQNSSTTTTQPSITATPTPTLEEKRIPKEPRNPLTPTTTPTPTATPSAQCKKEVGPVSITYPEEGSTISTDPVTIEITRTGDDYCAVVWSYRINGGSWSEYTDKSISIYGLSSGTKKVEVKVKSIVTGSETLLTRTFIMAGNTPTPTSTASATTQ